VRQPAISSLESCQLGAGWRPSIVGRGCGTQGLRPGWPSSIREHPHHTGIREHAARWAEARGAGQFSPKGLGSRGKLSTHINGAFSKDGARR